VMPKAYDWLTMRTNRCDIYTSFFDKFVKHVVGVARFKSESTEHYVSAFVKISDEAFALLVLENCEDRWKDMHERGVTRSQVPCKFTDGGVSVRNGRCRTHRGWSQNGLRRFKVLFGEVKKDRARENRPFEGQYMLHRKQHHANKGSEIKGKVAYPDDDISCSSIEDEMGDFEAPRAAAGINEGDAIVYTQIVGV